MSIVDESVQIFVTVIINMKNINLVKRNFRFHDRPLRTTNTIFNQLLYFELVESLDCEHRILRVDFIVG